MKAMLDQMERETPRPKSPHMNNEEPIELAHFPNADRWEYSLHLILTKGFNWNPYECRPRPGDPPRIERDDFPAPPYPYTDPERRRRWSESSKRVNDAEMGYRNDYDPRDVIDGENVPPMDDDPKLKVSFYFTLLFSYTFLY